MERKCKVEGCKNKHRARGFCKKHYCRERRKENPEFEVARCSEPGCNKYIEGDGKCYIHYKPKKTRRRERHGMSETVIYKTWLDMISRCTNPNNSDYHNYGGRGITYCDEWFYFTNFYKDMGDPPEGYTLDRIDVNGNYSPDNCRWASITTQARNKRISERNRFGVKGIVIRRRKNKIRYELNLPISNGKRKYIGIYDTIEEAKIAREEAEKKYWKND